MGLSYFSDDLHEIFTGIFMEFIPVGAKVPNDSSWIFYFKMGLNQQPDYSIFFYMVPAYVRLRVFDILDVFRCLEAQAKQPFVWLRESPWVACLGARLKWKWGYLCCGKPFCLFACQKTLADFCGAPMFEKSLKGRIEGWTRKDMGTSRPWCIPRGFFKTPLNENWADMLPLHCCDLFILYLDIYIYIFSPGIEN